MNIQFGGVYALRGVPKDFNTQGRRSDVEKQIAALLAGKGVTVESDSSYLFFTKPRVIIARNQAKDGFVAITDDSQKDASRAHTPKGQYSVHPCNSYDDVKALEVQYDTAKKAYDKMGFGIAKVNESAVVSNLAQALQTATGHILENRALDGTIDLANNQVTLNP